MGQGEFKGRFGPVDYSNNGGPHGELKQDRYSNYDQCNK